MSIRDLLEELQQADDPLSWARARVDTISGLNGAAAQVLAALHRRGVGLADIIALQAEVARPKELLDAGRHDYGNAVTTHILHGAEIIYTAEIGWMTWTGTHWSAAGAHSAVNAAIVDTLKQRSKAAIDADDRELLRAATPNNAKIQAATEQFKHLVSTGIGAFDSIPYLLNVANGVVDLRTGEMAAHEQSNRFSYCVGTAYEPDARSDLWLDSHLEWFNSDAERVQYVQRAMGYSATGDTREECLFYLWGPRGRNGKGTLVNTVADILGAPIAKSTNFSTFQNERADPQGFLLAPLRNARMVTASEPKARTRLNEGLIKTATGRDTMQVSFKGKTPFDMRPIFKMWLMANHPISGDPDDDAFWRRFRLIQFQNSYLGHEDATLKGRLLETSNREGILAWLVKGAMDWYRIGLGDPAWMADDLKAQRDESDGVGRFLLERCVADAQAEVGLDALYSAYKNWADDEGEKPYPKAWLGRKLRGKGYDTRRNTFVRPSVRFVTGLKLE